LSALSIWQRSVHAISWEGIKNIIPDFINYARQFWTISFSAIRSLHIPTITLAIFHFFKQSSVSLLLLFLGLIAAIAVFLIMRIILPHLNSALLSVEHTVKGGYFFSRVCALAIGFVNSHLVGFFIWFLLFLCVKFNLIVSPGVRLFVSVIILPYSLYLAHCFVQFLDRFNMQQGYVFLSEAFHKRFIRVLAVFLYSTIIILLVREILLLIGFIRLIKSELPTILLALYSIIFRTLLILLIGKEEILSIVPTHTVMWQWIWNQVNRFYYPLLVLVIGVMVASDPYIGGYGNLISYILWGSIWTALLVYVLYEVHLYIKQAASRIFFIVEGDTIKDRFAQAKTWYGSFVIVLFLIVVFIGLIIAARIWGIPITFQNFKEAFTQHLFSSAAVDEEGRRIPVTMLSFLKIIAFIFGGFALSSILNRFVFRRIFELLLVEAGVQNTVMSIARYIIVVTAFIVGFQMVGLSNVLLSIGVLIAGIGWIVHDPIKDFASYFILLVQRPIKIGDYILLDSETQGVVRQITPRSIVLRRNNSFSIIVPNSRAIGQAVFNWNYSRNFISLDDIIFTVNYAIDPERVRGILFKILDENVDILKSPTPIVRLENFADHGYQFLIRAFTSSPNTLRKWDIASDIRFAVAKSFRAENIKLAIPIRIIQTMQPSAIDEYPHQLSTKE
jgi:small-conductance mechanosensitive channel